MYCLFIVRLREIVLISCYLPSGVGWVRVLVVVVIVVEMVYFVGLYSLSFVGIYLTEDDFVVFVHAVS